MSKRHKRFATIFVILACINIYAEFVPSFELTVFVKPLICTSLAIYLSQRTGMKAGFNRLVLAALMLSLFGDCLLLFADDSTRFFIFGLIAFLLAHVSYSIAFFRDFKNDPQASKKFGHLMLFVMGVFSLSYYSWIRESLDDLRIPVMAYIFVISVMAILAGYRYKRVNLSSFRLIYAGAVFFVVSDSILAYNKFVLPFEHSGVLVMATYMLAQYLITLGTIERIVLPGSFRKAER